jgi:hypothetical protein
MSTAIALTPCYFGNEDYVPVSDSSRTIQETWQEKRYYLRNSATDWLPTIEGALNSIKDNCRNADWDCEGAFPITDCTIDLAARISATLFDLLMIGIPVPDLIPEVDGEICLSWVVDAARIFSLSVGEHGNINFAGQFGEEGGVHAWQPIDATSNSTIEESLADVARYIQKLYKPTISKAATE